MKFYKATNGRIYSETYIKDAFELIMGRPYNPELDKIASLVGDGFEIEPKVEGLIRDNQIVRASLVYYQQQRAAGRDLSVREAKEAVELIRDSMQNDIELLDVETALKQMQAIMDKTPEEK